MKRITITTECNYCFYKTIFQRDECICPICKEMSKEHLAERRKIKESYCIECKISKHLDDEQRCEQCFLKTMTPNQLTYRKASREFAKSPYGIAPNPCGDERI